MTTNGWIPTTYGGMTRDRAETRVLEIQHDLKQLSAHEKMTRAQEERYDELRFEANDLRTSLVREKLRSGEAKLEYTDPARDDEPMSAIRRGPSTHDDEPAGSQPGGMKTYPLFGGDQRDQAMRIVDQAHRSKDLPDHAAELVENLITDGTQLSQSMSARWAIVTGAPAYRTAFAKLCADPVRGHLLWTSEEADAHRAVAAFQSEQRAMSLTDASGGFMVPLTLDPAIMLTSAGSNNPLRQISRVVQTMTSDWTGITSAGVTAEWIAEATQVADASPTIDDAPIPVFKGDAFIPYSFEVGMDAVNFLSEMQKLLVDGADQLMATAYTTGNGTTAPKGIVTALTGTASEVNAAADDTFAKGDVYSLQSALPPRFQAGARWCSSLPIINVMSQFETTNGARLFPELSEGRLLNRPIHELSNMDSTITTSGAVSNFILLYGNFEQFVIVDRIGTTLELIPNLMGANGRPTGQRGALLWFRTGSDAPVINAFRMLDVASAA